MTSTRLQIAKSAAKAKSGLAWDSLTAYQRIDLIGDELAILRLADTAQRLADAIERRRETDALLVEAFGPETDEDRAAREEYQGFTPVEEFEAANGEHIWTTPRYW